jgi:hypothetical protein
MTPYSLKKIKKLTSVNKKGLSRQLGLSMQKIIRPIQIQTNKLERLQMVLTPKTGSLISIGNCSPDMCQWCQWSARY